MTFIPPTETEGKENVNSDNRRQLRATVRDRIKQRTANRNNIGSGDRNSGSSSGSSSGSGDGNDAEQQQLGNASAGVDNGSKNEQRNNDERGFSLRITDRNASGRNDNGTGSDGDGNRNSDRDNGRNNEQTERVSTVVPVITPDKIFGDDEPRTKRKYTRRTKTTVSSDSLIKPLKIACKFVFDLPVTVGWGEHWTLEESEANDLAVCLKDVLDAFPSKTSKDFLRSLEKWMPVISLAITLYGITAPRVALTRQLNHKRKLELQNAENQQREKSSVRQFVN